MNLIRIALTSLTAASVLLLAACSQPATPPSQAPQTNETVVQTPASDTQVSAQTLVWKTGGLYNPPSSGRDFGQYSSVAINSAGNPVIAYYDATRNAPTAPNGPNGNGDLKLMVCGSPDCTSNNTFVTVDRGQYYTDDTGRGASLVLNSRGFPVISYFDLSNGLKLASCGDATCTRISIQVVWSSGKINGDGNTSLTLDKYGNPVIAFSNSGSVVFVRCTSSSCDTAHRTQWMVDYGAYSSLALDMNNNPIISYYDIRYGDLKIAYCNVDCSSKTLKILDSTGDVGKFSALELLTVRDATGAIKGQRPFISYYDATNGDLKIAYCGNLTCSSNNYFQTLDSSGNVGQYTSVGFSSSLAKPIISYYDVTNGDLKVAICDPGSPYTLTPTAPCQQTQRNTIQAIDPDFRANVGQYNSLVMDGSGNALISYYDATNLSLKWARQFNQ